MLVFKIQMVENCLGKVTKLVFERNSLTYSRKAIHASNSLFQKSINSNEILGAAVKAWPEQNLMHFKSVESVSSAETGQSWWVMEYRTMLKRILSKVIWFPKTDSVIKNPSSRKSDLYTVLGSASPVSGWPSPLPLQTSSKAFPHSTLSRFLKRKR